MKSCKRLLHCICRLMALSDGTLKTILITSAFGGEAEMLMSASVECEANVELRGGISPPRAPRHVREPLDSYGSRCSAVAMT